MAHARRIAAAAALALLLAAPTAAAAPGDLDPSFGGDGVVHASAGGGASVEALALSGDRILAAGGRDLLDCRDVMLAAWRVADGAPDASLGSGGVAAPSLGPCDDAEAHAGHAFAAAAAPDGRIFTGGFVEEISQTFRHRALLTGHTATGALDASFGDGGQVRDEFLSGAVNALVRLPDGRLVAGGYRFGIGRTQWEVHRYLSDGDRDPSFDGDGAATYPWVAGGPNEVIAAMVADGDDGAVVAVGESKREAGAEDPPGVVIGRIRADGTLDPGFGTGGRTRLEPDGLRAGAHDVVRTSDGGFAVAVTVDPTIGPSPAPWYVAKFTSSGHLDPTFGAGGIVTGRDGAAGAIAVDAADRLVVGVRLGDAGFGVARYLTNGAVDSSFGTDGVVTLPADGMLESEVPADVLVQPDGRIVVAGTTRQGDQAAMSVYRLLGGGDGGAASPGESGSSSSEGEIGTGMPPGPGIRPPTVIGLPSRQGGSRGRVTIDILSRRVTRRGVLVRVRWPRGTEGTARARLWTRNKGVLLGQRTIAVLRGTIGRRFRIPLNRRARRMLRGGRVLKVRATVRVTGLPARR